MLLILFRMLARLPLPFMQAIGALAGRIIFSLAPRYRRCLLDNLRQAGHQGVQSAAIREAGKSLAELPFVWCAPSARVLATAQVENWAIAQAALAQGRGVIFLTPHLGCFEIIAQVIAAKMPLTALYRPPRKVALQPLMEGARQRANLHLAPANLGGVRTLMKTLKAGGAIGLLPDQVPQHGEGVWADFFGKPAYTMTLSAKLQRMTGAPIVLTFAERRTGGRGYVVRFALFAGELSDDPVQQASAINRAMEQLIAHCPAQYFWGYNRYKTPAGVVRSDA